MNPDTNLAASLGIDTRPPGNQANPLESDLKERIKRALRELVDADYISLARWSSGAREAPLGEMANIIQAALTEPLVALSPEQRAARLLDHWRKTWPQMAHSDGMFHDIVTALKQDREEVARYGVAP